MRDDPTRHVCECQLVHATMLMARKGLSGHSVYNRVRNAAECLEVLSNGAAFGLTDEECERGAVEVLHAATAGDEWEEKARWCTRAPVREWHGVTTDERGLVTEIELKHNGLSGTLPSSIGNLMKLTVLNLANNKLEGTQVWSPSAGADDDDSPARLLILCIGSIPASIGALSSLERLELRENRFSGTHHQFDFHQRET